MKILLFVVGWCILLALSWPLALLLLALLPLVLLAGLIFSAVGLAAGAVLALAKAVLFLPARLLGYRG
ncbi:MAG: hypothetical protein U1F58_08345 [Burkholderiales bacterium]